MNLYIEDVGVRNTKIIKKVLEKYNIRAPISLHIISKRDIRNIEIKLLKRKIKQVVNVEIEKVDLIDDDETLKRDCFKLASHSPIHKCKYSSCLGKTIYISREQVLSFCPIHADKTIIGKIDEVDNLFENKIFENYLKKMISKRNKCMEKCEFFEFCKGGCAFENNCDKYKDTQKKVIDELNKLVEDGGELNQLPEYKQDAIINLLFGGKRRSDNEK